MKFNVNNKSKSNKIFENIKEFFDLDNPKEDRAVRYLEIWRDKFWITMDESIVEFVKSYEDKIGVEFGAEFAKFNSNAGYSRTLSSERRSQLQQRIRKFISPQMLAELSEVINILKGYDNSVKVNQFILIDGLDENWVESSIKYEMIQSLIECLKKLRRITDLKIIVAVRSDIMEKVTRENAHGRFQVEKYEDYIQRIKWDKDQLKSLINKRINHLYQYQYHSDNIFFEDLFSTKVRKKDAYNYIIDRTLLRPRDIIIFANTAFEMAKGSVAVNESSIIAAEKIYSESRRRALVGEWANTFPAIEPMIECLEGRNYRFNFSEVISDQFLSLLVDVVFADKKYKSDPLYNMIENCTGGEGGFSIKSISSEVFERLYIAGAVGLKIGSNDPWQWFYKSQKIISKSNMKENSKIEIHPMLYAACNVKIAKNI